MKNLQFVPTILATIVPVSDELHGSTVSETLCMYRGSRTNHENVQDVG